MTSVSPIEGQKPVLAVGSPLPATTTIDLLICVTCRSAVPTESAAPDPDAPRDGALLLDLLKASRLPENVAIRSVECLSNCTRGCTLALRGDGRWTYIYGNINPVAHLETLIDGITRYSASADGLVPWRERPDHFRKNCIARIPPLEAPNV